MSVACVHWSECDVNGGGCCALGLYGSKPSLGTCGVCLKHKIPPEERAKLRPKIKTSPIIVPSTPYCPRCGGQHHLDRCPIDPTYDKHNPAHVHRGRCCS